jgi:hypothetical protein
VPVREFPCFPAAIRVSDALAHMDVRHGSAGRDVALPASIHRLQSQPDSFAWLTTS